MKYIHYLIVACMLFACSTCFGQQPKPLEIRDLKGMDTRLPDFSRPTNIPTELINVDLRKTGSYGSRLGYNVYYTPGGIDSLIGMIPLKFSDGEEMMVALVDPDDSDWGKLIAFTNTSARKLDTLFFMSRGSSSDDGFLCFYPFVNADSDCDLVMVVTVNDGGVITHDTIVTIAGHQASTLTDLEILNAMEVSIAAAMTPDTADVFENYYRDSIPGTDTMYYVLDYQADRDETVSINFEWAATSEFGCDFPTTLHPYCQPESEVLYFEDAAWTVGSYQSPEIEQIEIFDKMPITKSFDAEIMNDIVYFASGGISQVAWDRQNTFLNPPLRPGELWVAEFPKPSGSTAGYFLDGSYYYAVGQLVWYDSAGIDHSKWREPYVLTGPIKVDSGYVNIKGFQSGGTFAFDDASGIYDTLGTPDSVGLYLFRTRAYPEPLNQLDTLFKVKGWMLAVGDVATNAFEFDTLTHVDSLPDSFMDDDTTFIAARQGELLGKQNDNGVGADVPYDNFYGGPYFVENGIDAGPPLWGVNTLIGWNDTDEDTLAWVYAMSYKDTISGLSSQFGPYLAVYTPQGNNPLDNRPVIIGPAPNEELCASCIIEYWKAPVYGERLTGTSAFGHSNTTYTLCSGEEWQERWIFEQLRFKWPNIVWECGAIISRSMVGMADEFIIDYYQDWTLIDTFEIPGVTQFRFMGTQQKDNDPEFYDTVFTWTDVTSNELAHQSFTPASSPAGITILGRSGDRMIGASGTRLWWSEINNVNYWGAYNNIQIGASDGSDEITGFYSARGILRVFGENFSYTAYGETWGLSELTGKWGCVAPRSLATGIRGAYFLSNQGVIHETEGGELERKYERDIISLPISEFDDMPRATKRNAVGVVFDNKFMLSIPDDDITWVWDELAEGWSKWTNITMGGAAVKKDTLFFFKPGGRTIYSYGTSHLDDNNDVVWEVTFPPMFVDRDEEMVTDIGIWTRDTSVAEGVDIKVYGPNNTWDSSVDGFTSITLNKRQVIKALSPYGHLPVSTIINMKSHANLEDGQVFIDGIDVYYKKMNSNESE